MVLLNAAFGIFDALRLHILVRIGVRIDRRLRGPVFAAVPQLPLRTKAVGDGLQPVRDLDQIPWQPSGHSDRRGFCAGHFANYCPDTPSHSTCIDAA
jgi:ABC-type protease/lipase transport system fused ATPase/permease subunit